MLCRASVLYTGDVPAAPFVVARMVLQVHAEDIRGKTVGYAILPRVMRFVGVVDGL